jgi:hypothetical protein
MVWILGRLYCTGTPEDYEKTHAMQDAISIVPLSSWGKPYTAPDGVVDPTVDSKTPVRTQVNKLDAVAYFALLAKLMKDNPPTPADAPMVQNMAKIGIVPGEPFDSAKLDAAMAVLMQDIPRIGFAKIANHMAEAGTRINGWLFTTKAGTYGTDYLQRAFVTAIGLGANRPQDAVYPTSDNDEYGRPYMGTTKYTMHFDKGQLPPAEGFWSLTMYNEKYFFVANPLNRYTLSSRNKFIENADGSVDFLIQHDSPGKEKEANWLPTPEGRFILMLRLYRPREAPPSIIDGTWKPPAVKKAA